MTATPTRADQQPTQADVPAEPATDLPADLPSAPTTRGGYVRLVLVLGALTAIGPLTVDLYLPGMPTIAREFAVSDAAVQATITGMLVGLAVGQLLVGPLSDALGRRKPLLGGLVLHMLSSVGCALAPTVGLLTLARGVQGFAGASVSVVTLAVVRDLYTGNAAASLLSRLMLVVGIVPVLAPSLGAVVLRLTSWRGVFVILAVVAVLLFALALVALRETLPRERRRPARPAAVLLTYRTLLSDRPFVALVVVGGAVFSSLFGYISGVSFALQDTYGLTTAQFGIVFAWNAMGLVFATQANPFLLRRFGSLQILRVAVLVGAGAGAVLVVATLTGVGGLPLVLACIWLILGACGFTFPNTPALALSRHGEAAGTAAALLGAAQFAVGGMAAPAVGAFGSGSAVPMAVVMATGMTVGALVCWLALRRDTMQDAATGSDAVVVAH